jgi:hypothetical protein
MEKRKKQKTKTKKQEKGRAPISANGCEFWCDKSLMPDFAFRAQL